jgi:hypothetical protein
MPILTGVIASGISGNLNIYDGPYGAYDALATVTLSTSASAVTFTGIPSNYKHLQIRGIARAVGTGGGSNGNLFVRFNGDTSANYTRHLLYMQGGITVPASAAQADTSQAYMSAAPNSNNSSNIFSGTIMDILDYNNPSKFKTTRTIGGYSHNGVGTERLSFESSLWRNLNPIQTISISTESDNLAAYTSFALYGVK